MSATDTGRTRAGRSRWSGSAGSIPATRRRALRLAVARHRRLLAAATVAAAVTAAVQATGTAGPPTATVWVAGRDLAAGQPLAGADLRRQTWPRSALPDGVSADRPVGVLASGLRRGEPVTDARLLGTGVLTGQPASTVALVVRVADPAATVLVTPGSRVDVLALPSPVDDVPGTDPVPGDAEVVADRALVLAAPGGSGSADGSAASSGGLPGGLGAEPVAGSAGPVTDGSAAGTSGVLVLAVDRRTAARLAGAQASRSLTVVLT